MLLTSDGDKKLSSSVDFSAIWPMAFGKFSSFSAKILTSAGVVKTDVWSEMPACPHPCDPVSMIALLYSDTI